VSEIITQEGIRALAAELLGQGVRVIAPVHVKADRYFYQRIAKPEQIAFDGFIHPGNSIKEFFFPRHEAIYTYAFKGPAVELADAEVDAGRQVILCARPCDAAALPVMDSVFNWDFQDKFYNERRASTTVVALACADYDDNCFCTSVGLGPAAEKGSDAMLLPAGDQYEVRGLTDKGRALFAGKTQQGAAAVKTADGPAPSFDAGSVREFLAKSYESPVWKEIALRCLGCGACAYVCPTCHCFDIVDEGTALSGCRAKNWDSCQFPMFTMHASGHNPRANQGQRQRQRIQHKFRIYPEKFGEILCTGCGNCTRQCPVSLGVLSAIEIIKNAPKDTSEVG